MTDPTSNSALRLAMLSLIERPSLDYESILLLLDFAQAATEDDATRDFAAFLQPMVRRLADQQRQISAGEQERRSLEDQLEALKELEEELNAGGDPR